MRYHDSGKRLWAEPVKRHCGGTTKTEWGFSYFDTEKAIELLRQHILEEIKHCGNITALELRLPTSISKKTVNCKSGTSNKVIAAGEAFPVLLEEVRRVQDPNHEMCQS